MSAILKALAALVRASHNYDEVEEQTADHWRALASAARNEYDTARAKLTRLCDVEPRRSLLELCDDAEVEVECEWEQRKAAEEEVAKLRAEIERLALMWLEALADCDDLRAENERLRFEEIAASEGERAYRSQKMAELEAETESRLAIAEAELVAAEAKRG